MFSAHNSLRRATRSLDQTELQLPKSGNLACAPLPWGFFSPVSKNNKTAKAVPTFRADGRRVRDYSMEAIARLLALGMIVIARSRKGRITCAQFKSDAGANPLVKSAHMGQQYSYEQALPSGHYAWRHREMIQRQDVEMLFGERPESKRELDLYVRAIFRAVPLSCLRSTPEPAASSPVPARAKVVSITSGRGFRRANEIRRAA